MPKHIGDDTMNTRGNLRKTIVFTWINPIEEANGGIERVTHRLMQGLSTRGHKCHYLQHEVKSNQLLSNGLDVGPLRPYLERLKADIVINQNGYSSIFSEQVQASGWRGRYIVCHHNEPLYLRKLYGLFRAWTVVTSPNEAMVTRIAWAARLTTYPLWQWTSRRLIARTQAINYRAASQYVVLSPSYVDQLSELLNLSKPHHITAIANPLSFDTSPSEAALFQKKNAVLVVARLNDAEKRISAALHAWQIIEACDTQGWNLTIVGDGPDAGVLRAKALEMRLRRVMFVGHQDPFEYYRSASILLMTSRVEGWGLTLTEAMQTGTVPIAFDAYASLKDIVDNGDTGVIVANNDVAALASATLRIMQDGSLRTELSNRARLAAQRFSLDKVLDQWEEIL